MDINSDVGESFGRWKLGDDQAVMEHVTSINVACGFHAGDPHVMRLTCKEAISRNIAIGAHPAYRDLQGFGRRFLDVEPELLKNEVIYQVGALEKIAATEGGKLSYVKPHGGLYHSLLEHEPHTGAVIEALKELGGHLPLMTMPFSLAEQMAQAEGIPVIREAFADRGYLPNGKLVPRNQEGAILSVEEIPQHVLGLAEGKIRAIDGSELEIDAQSICVHGDSPAAVAMAASVRNVLEKAGHRIEALSSEEKR